MSKSGAEPAQRKGNASPNTWRVEGRPTLQTYLPRRAIEMKHGVTVPARCARWCCHRGMCRSSRESVGASIADAIWRVHCVTPIWLVTQAAD